MRKKGKELLTSLHDFIKKGHSKLEKKYPTFDLAIYSKFLKTLKHARLAFLEFVSTILPTFYVTNSNEKMFHHVGIFPGMHQGEGQVGQLPHQILADQKAPPGSGGAPHYYLPHRIFDPWCIPVYASKLKKVYLLET